MPGKPRLLKEAANYTGETFPTKDCDACHPELLFFMVSVPVLLGIPVWIRWP